jgi:hypothetical protein
VELLGGDGTVLLTLTGPESGSGPTADIWNLVMEALLPVADRVSRLGAPWAPTSAVHRKGSSVSSPAAGGRHRLDPACLTDGSLLRSSAAQGT